MDKSDILLMDETDISGISKEIDLAYSETKVSKKQSFLDFIEGKEAIPISDIVKKTGMTYKTIRKFAEEYGYVEEKRPMIRKVVISVLVKRKVM